LAWKLTLNEGRNTDFTEMLTERTEKDDTPMKVVIGTRGSALAQRQTNMIAAALRRHWPDLGIRLHIIRTTGDRNQGTSLQVIGGQGVFVKEIEEALLSGQIDLAVHSLKDLPGEIAPGLALAAVPKRADARDALISRGGQRLLELPPGATIGTGSARRAAQLRALRPDCIIADLRGNVDTRLRKALDPAGPYDAIVLALAGLRRLRRSGVVTEILPYSVMLPAPGQGALGLEIRADDVRLRELLAPLDDPATHAAVTAERAFLAALGGGCQAPIAAFGRVRANQLHLTGLLGQPDGTLRRADIHSPLVQAMKLGHELADELKRDHKDAERGMTRDLSGIARNG
jgi:hydroxymethylbilane synthase